MSTFKEQISQLRLAKKKVQGFGQVEPPCNPALGNTQGLPTDFNRGPWRFTSSWGYFSASFNSEFLVPIVRWFEEVFSVKFAEVSGGKFYTGGLEAPDGLRIDTGNVNGGTFRVQLPAEYLRTIGPSNLAGFVWRLNTFAPNVTRLDMTLDHEGYGVPRPRGIWEQLRSQKIYLCSHRHANFEFHGGSFAADDGDTLYVGDRADSDCFLRIYDLHGPTRWEAELKGDKARGAWEIFSAQVGGEGLHESVAECVASVVLGQVGFREYSQQNTSRNPVAGFFRRINSSIDAAPVKLQLPEGKVNEKMHDKLEWLRSKVSKPLAEVFLHFRDVWPTILSDLIREGEGKLTPDRIATILSLQSRPLQIGTAQPLELENSELVWSRTLQPSQL